MKVSNELATYVARNEGFSRYTYLDTEGIPTIGIGFNLEEGFSMEESKLILMHRLGKLADQLPDAIPVFKDMDEVRQRVLIDMAYNLGIAGLKKFRRMLAALERREYEEAAKELLDSRYAAQVKGRAVRNARMMETGEWENL